MREIWVTNTESHKREKLETRVPGKLSLYSCGPTVYGHIHIGNLRAALTSDMFFRYFKRAGYEVTYVRNYTDVDDKIIKRANVEGVPADEVSKKYTVEVEKDYALAGMQEPTHKTKVTEHMPEIIAMIEQIIKNGKAYAVAVEGGASEVFFSIESFENYGRLSGKNIEDLQAGIRVDVREQKRNPLDFSLWKPAKPGEPSWDSPWGKGRPGWHIECSAMSCKWLGSQIDVHHGGIDLVFPHHENEIAQSEAASGEKPFSRYWLHHAFVNMSKEKMSKSLGNVVSARDFLVQYGSDIARYLLLGSHYRSPIDFTDDSIEQVLTALHRIYEAKDHALKLSQVSRAVPDMRAESMWGEFCADVEKTRREIDDAYALDFNTPGAIAALMKLIREFNRVTKEPLAQATPSAVLGAQALIQVMEDDIGSVLGFGRLTPEKGLGEIARVRAARPAEGGAAKPQPAEIEAAIQARVDARKAKNFAEADRIRKDLESRGVQIKDAAGGTTWEYA